MLKEIQITLRKTSSQKGKEAAHKFVPSSQNVYGVRMPVINELAKKYKDGGFQLADSLWNSGAFEERMLAAKILAKMAKKDPAKTISSIKRYSKEVSVWAVCDTLGTQSSRAINKTHANEIFSLADELIGSKNFWQRRLALVLAEWYTRDKSFHPKIKSLLSKVKDDKEYYVKKAIVWINRNFHLKR